MSTISLRLPEYLHEAVRELAKRENISINQLATLAIAEKVSALETADYLLRRAARADRASFQSVLDKAPDDPPAADDAL